MKSQIEREFVQNLTHSILEKKPYLFVVYGPRQVGKTTGVIQALKKIKHPHHYVTADGDLAKPSSWIFEEWTKASSKFSEGVFVIDEIQKVENWSGIVKKIWDEQKIKKSKIQWVLLGSSSLQIQTGIRESLAGRVYPFFVPHWDPEESKKAYGLSLEEYICFGGYPGSYDLRSKKNEWLQYMKHSLIDAVVGKDILSVHRVKSPTLFKQSFELACSYAAQEISYTKLLGQLQEKGNTELIKHYLELFEEAFLLKQLFKYSNKKTLQKSSSPKILPLCPALFSMTLDADLSKDQVGRAFEVTVGSMLSQIQGGELFYWREKNAEVDFVYRYGKKLWAIEVKSGREKSKKGLQVFCEKFPNGTPVLLDQENFQKEILKIKSEVEED